MSKSMWGEWIKTQNLPQEQIKHLRSATDDALGTEIRVTRQATETLYMKPPKFEDVYGLMPLLSALSFNQNVILKGPQGVAKSLCFYAWAAAHNVPVVVEDCTEDTRDYRLKGSQTVVGGDFVYVLGSLPTAIDVANEVGKCLLLFEELNALTPTTQKALNPVADFRKRISLPHIGKTYELREGAQLWVCGTMNPAAWSGTYELNRDLRSRFEEVEVDYLQDAKEAALLTAVYGHAEAGTPTKFPVKLWVRLAQETRKEKRLYPLSPRDMLRVLHNADRIGTDKTLSLIMGRAEGKESKDLLAERITSIFGTKVSFQRTWGG